MRIKKLLQTPFVTHDGKNLLMLEVEDFDNCNPYGVEVLVGERAVFSERIFAYKVRILLPVFSEPTNITVRITPFEDTPIEREYTLGTPKELRVPILYSSHEDLGYCAYIEKLHRECYEYLLAAMKLCRENADFRYMVEHVWWLDAFDSYATECEREELRAFIRNGQIEINPIHSGVHTSWQDSEMLVRSMYFGAREAKEKYGADAKCAVYTDLSGFTKSIIPAYYDMGIRYVSVLFNDFRNNLSLGKLPPVFRWRDGESGKSLVLWWQRGYRPGELREILCDRKRQYDEGEFFMDESRAYGSEEWFSNFYSSFEGYPADVFPISFYDDREMPTTMLLTFCREMARRWKYPKFEMGLPGKFLAEIEKKFGDVLPTFTGDVADQWADFATIAPRLTAKRRALSRKLYDAELLSALLGEDNRDITRRAAWSACSYDEHCFATSSKHPQAMHRHNIEKVKAEPIESSVSELDAAIRGMTGEADEVLALINTLPRKRRAGLHATVGEKIPYGIPHQILPSGELITAEIDFSGVEAKKFTATEATSTSREIDAEAFETPFYRVRINKLAKKICSIVDIKSGRELIDRDTNFELGQFVYTYNEGKFDRPTGIEFPKKREIRVFDGEVAFVITALGYEEQSAATVKTAFIFYKDRERIDVRLSYENLAGLIGDFNDRYKKNFFFAFPFNIRDPEFYTELAVGELHENEPRLMGVSDFTVSVGSVAAEGDGYGVMLYSRDMPVFHLSSIKFNRFGKDLQEEKGHVFLYASSNRSNNLIYKSLEECRADYSLSILPYAEGSEISMKEFSEECDRELLVGGKAQLPALSLEAKSARITSVKPSADSDGAITVRVLNFGGTDSTARLTLPFVPTAVFYADSLENELDRLDFENNTLQIKLKPYGYTTVKVFG